MHVYYKFGLLLIFLLNVSIRQTLAVPAKSVSNDYLDDDYNDYEDNDEMSERTDNNNGLISTSSTTTTTYRPIFNIPRRSNHVLEPSCPRACHCMEDFKYVQCANAHLTHIPLDMPKTAAIIDLSHNVIAELRAEDFANLTKAIEINLNNNLLSRLDKEAFHGLERLRRLRLANNRLTDIDPDTFAGAIDLSMLDLSNNTIKQQAKGSFLNQPSLIDFSCSNCSWTYLPEQTFYNMSALNTLRLDHNDFNQQINTRAFAPLKTVIKLKLPELDQANIEELCNLLKTIDNISFKHFNVSCFELVLGTSFKESLIRATDPPFKPITGLPTALPTGTVNRQKPSKMSNVTISPTVIQAGITTSVTKGGINATNATATVATISTTDEEKPYQVPISQDIINTLLLCIMGVAIIGIIIGLICRKDIGGIKTKCCRTRKPEPKDQVHPTEEIPLNKLA